MNFTKDDILSYLDNARFELRCSNIKASIAIEIVYAAIEDSEDVLYQQGYDKAKEDMIKVLEDMK